VRNATAGLAASLFGVRGRRLCHHTFHDQRWRVKEVLRPLGASVTIVSSRCSQDDAPAFFGQETPTDTTFTVV
jgi:hypothetical protein